jgi:SAM-dependent methyltransferase
MKVRCETRMSTFDSYLREIRLAELEFARGFFPVSGSVLEIGAGTGWQAMELSRAGFRVSAVDLADSPYHSQRVFSVQEYDGRNLPFPPSSFDVVFSSNVLEHVTQLQPLFSEMCRVLKPGGLMIHVVPTGTWRFWTLVAHIPRLVGVTFELLGVKRGIQANAARDSVARHSVGELVRRTFVPAAHGVGGSAFEELGTFRVSRWLGEFQRAGLAVEVSRPTGIFYTGYLLFPQLMTIARRRQISRLVGSACQLFVARPMEV